MEKSACSVYSGLAVLQPDWTASPEQSGTLSRGYLKCFCCHLSVFSFGFSAVANAKNKQALNSQLIVALLNLKKICCQVSLLATFIPPRRPHVCQLALQISLLDKGFSPPGKYVELGLCFISRQPSKANWPEPGEFSSVLIGEAEKV